MIQKIQYPFGIYVFVSIKNGYYMYPMYAGHYPYPNPSIQDTYTDTHLNPQIFE